jgi:DNA segregation ATPase FtsK/SpoIIIE, S-DNA-T family
MARKKRRGRKKKGMAIKSGTLLMLLAILLFFFGCLLFLSYTNNGLILTRLNEYLFGFFGILGFLVAVNCILLSLLVSRINAAIAKPTVSIGFLVVSVALFGMFQSGIVGRELFVFLATLLGVPIAYAIFFVATILGVIVFLNISFSQVFAGLQAAAVGTGSFISEKIMPMFKSKKTFSIPSVSPLPPTINGLAKEPVVNQKRPDDIKPVTATAQTTQMSEKKGTMSDELVLNKPLEMGVWEYPPLSLLAATQSKRADTGDIKKIAATIEKTLQSFGIQARVAEINCGPSVTQYALEISLGTKLSKITGLSNDLALATEAPTGQIRIEAPIPGRNLVGIEIPNRGLEVVPLRKMLESSVMQKNKSKLAVPLGLDVAGNPVVADIGRMPHVLIAGTTGSGKSVLVNCIISSLLFRASPSEVKMIMIDPKRVEMAAYRDIPHLLAPVVVEPEQSVSALKWALKEMDRRYIKFAEAGVRNIEAYNELAGFQALPFIVILIDELADLMAVASVEVEDCIARLAQMARATGIHLVLATQRPSVDVITGLIKANVPCRIAFNVSSMVDSKVVLDSPGAEKLLGRGDMLYMPPDQARPHRIQGTYVQDQDIKRLVNFIKDRGIPVQYTSEVTEQAVNLKGKNGSAGELGGDTRDDLFAQAVRLVCQYDKASSSMLQRRFQIGFNRAARLLEQLEAAGVVGTPDGSKPREVLVKNPDEFLSSQGLQ